MAKEKKKKGSYGKVLGFCTVVACLAALLGWGFGGDGFGLGGGGFGFGGSNGNGGNDNSNGGSYAEYNTDYNPYQNEPYDDTDGSGYTNGMHTEVVRVIRVVRDSIYHGEQEITIGELEQILDELGGQNHEWELVDEQAISETYDNVLALMLGRGIDPVFR